MIMKPIKFALLSIFILVSFDMIAQDTLALYKPQKKLSKAGSLEIPVMNTSGLNYPYKSDEFLKTASFEDPVQHTSVFNYRQSDTNKVICIGAFNVPRGAVLVTAGDRLLQEGIDYTVNYQIGTVQILDPSFAVNNIPIQVSVEE